MLTTQPDLFCDRKSRDGGTYNGNEEEAAITGTFLVRDRLQHDDCVVDFGNLGGRCVDSGPGFKSRQYNGASLFQIFKGVLKSQGSSHGLRYDFGCRTFESKNII